jgi:hypothetical protein
MRKSYYMEEKNVKRQLKPKQINPTYNQYFPRLLLQKTQNMEGILQLSLIQIMTKTTPTLDLPILKRGWLKRLFFFERR